MMRLQILYCLVIAVITVALLSPVHARESSFAVPDGLRGAINFWKQIFTRYSSSEVVLFDPLDPGTVYSVLQAADNDEGRAALDKERARIVSDYGLSDDESRIRAQRGAKENFAEGLKISGRYIDQMRKIFLGEGLPAELAYLPLVESSFNVRARSGIGAVGMWQFMPETGKKFMRIDAKVDERRDPVESTKAAARLLKENYSLLGNWPLAITAYNHGTDGIFRAIKAVESEDLVDLIRGYESPTFGFVSKNFYAEFLAVVELARNKDMYFPFLRTHAPLVLREVPITRQAPLRSVLKPAAISETEFFDWNPALDPTVKLLPAGYRIKLPPEKVDEFIAAERRVERSSSKPAVSGARPPSKKANSIRSVSGKSAKGDSHQTNRVLAAAHKPPGSTKISLTRRHAPVKLVVQH